MNNKNEEVKKDLPLGWVESLLGNLVEISTGKWDANHAKDNGKYRFYTCAYKHFYCDTKRFDGECLILPGNGANVGEVFYYDGEFDAYQRTYVIFNIKILPKFLFHNLTYYWKKRNEGKQYGSATNYIRIGNFLDYNLTLPPLPEQQRIADKIEKLFTRSKKIKTNLDQVPKQLERLRKSILAAAVRGDLTKDWRFDSAHRPDYLEEPDYTNKNSIDNYNLRPNEIPDSWKWDYVRNLGEHILGKMLDAAKNKGEPTFYLRNINVRWFDFDLSNLLEIKATSEDKKKFDLRNGDVFICEGGEPGRAAVWSNGNSELIFQKAIHRIRLNNYVDPYWFVYNLKVDADNGVLSKFFTGTGIAHLTLKSLSSYQIPLPPLAEQKEIVRRVEKLLANVDKLEAAYKQHSQKLNTLNQSILAKAFRGELVPQDPNDEPASVLLERIKAEKGK